MTSDERPETAVATVDELPAALDTVLVALSPADLGPAQAALRDFCVRQDALLARELEDLEANATTAAEMGWKLGPVSGAIRRAQQRRDYYRKMQAAVEAGYLLVPNFPVQVLAVRVSRAAPRPVTGHYVASTAFNTPAERLPQGVGRYVDDRVTVTDTTHTETDSAGKTREVREYTADEYDAPDFPVRAVKPVVLTAAAQAMALRLFDRIGMVQNQSGRDPILVGQLMDPRGGGRMATFFLAWWLDVETL